MVEPGDGDKAKVRILVGERFNNEARDSVVLMILNRADKAKILRVAVSDAVRC